MAGTALAIKFEGLDEAVARYRAFSESSELAQDAGRVLYRRGARILAVSKRLVPVDLGALRASGHVTIPEVSAVTTTVTIAFGGTAAPYALIVHEDLHVHHRVGQAKYLETAFLAERDGALADLKDWLRQLLAAKRGFRRLSPEVAAEQAAAGAIGLGAFSSGRGFRGAEAIGRGLGNIGRGLS